MGGPASFRSILLVALLAGALAKAPAEADQLTQAGSLGAARGYAPVVWTGSSLLVFGGYNFGHHSQILRYTESGTTTVAFFSGARAASSAVWTGTQAYVFGGNNHAGVLAAIVRVDPFGAVTTLPATLPSARTATSAVWTGSEALVFGGCLDSACATTTDQIVRFDPQTNGVTVAGAKLPTSRAATSAVWIGESAYIFGGCQTSPCGSGGGARYGDILRYDPVADRLEPVAAALPTPRGYTAAYYDGHNAFVFGGDDGTFLKEVLRFDPSASQVTRMARSLPEGGVAGSAAWAGGQGIVLPGHWCHTGPLNTQIYCDKVYVYRTTPGPVEALEATPGSTRGTVVLTWPPIAPDTYSSLTYRVWRSSSAGETLVAETVATTATDSGCRSMCAYRVEAIDRGVDPGPMSPVAKAWVDPAGAVVLTSTHAGAGGARLPLPADPFPYLP